MEDIFYVNVDEDSFHFSTLQNILNIYEHKPEEITKEYLIRGLCNSLKEGYKIKKITQSDDGIISEKIFESIIDFIMYLANNEFNLNNILFIIKDTLNSGYDLSLKKTFKINVENKTQKQIEDLLIRIKNGTY